MPIFVSDTPLSPMGPSSPSQEGLFTDLRLLSLEKQLNIELKVDIVSRKIGSENKRDGYKFDRASTFFPLFAKKIIDQFKLIAR